MTTARPKGKRYSSNTEERKMIKTLSQLEQFEEYCSQILPTIREQIKNGAKAEEIYERFQALAAARAVTIAMTDVDSSKAVAAIKDILDRTQGKAKERTEHTHRYENLPEKELDALLQSEIKDLKSRLSKVQ